MEGVRIGVPVSAELPQQPPRGTGHNCGDDEEQGQPTPELGAGPPAGMDGGGNASAGPTGSKDAQEAQERQGDQTDFPPVFPQERPGLLSDDRPGHELDQERHCDSDPQQVDQGLEQVLVTGERLNQPEPESHEPECCNRTVESLRESVSGKFTRRRRPLEDRRCGHIASPASRLWRVLRPDATGVSPPLDQRLAGAVVHRAWRIGIQKESNRHLQVPPRQAAGCSGVDGALGGRWDLPAA